MATSRPELVVMSFKPPTPTKSPTISRTSNKDWLKGTVTAFDSGRTPTNGLISASNVMLDQDGTVRPRPSLIKYGPQPVGTVLGQIFECKVQTGLTSVKWNVSMQNVSGVTNVYVAKGEDSTWTKCTGFNYDNSALAHYIQIQNKVLVMNGTNSLSYLDLSTFTVTIFAALTTPAVPTLNAVSTHLTGTGYNVYYAVTANSTVGETGASPTLKQVIKADRDLWDPTQDSVAINWTTVSGVKSWNVYMGDTADGSGVPTMYLIAGGLDALTLAFTDNGTRAQDLNRPAPKTNSTAGPKVSRGAVINDRAWLVGDKDNPFYLWRGGDYGFELDFSPANGGGFSPVGTGGKEIPVSVMSFRNGKGDPMITVLTQGSNGQGRRYLVNQATVTYGSTTIVYYQIQEDSGNDGTDSPDGVISYQNSLYYPSVDGFKTTGTLPQLQNVLTTNRITNTIQSDVARLNADKMPFAVGVAYEGRLYWSLPVGSDTNSEIWTLDLDRGGAWMKPWNVGADWMWLYNDNDGLTHLLVLQNNSIYELSHAQMTNDDNVPFLTSGNSGISHFSDDGREWAKLINVVFTLLRPQGNISFVVSAFTDDGVQSYTYGEDFGVDTTAAGWSEPSKIGIVGWGRHRWSGVESVPEVSGVASTDVIVEIDEEAQWWTYGWSSSGSGVNYQLSAVTPEFVNIGIKDLS